LNLRVEEYFEQMRSLLAANLLIESFSLKPEKRDDAEGFIRGEINFIDGSVLYIREFVSVEVKIECDMYSYQYMAAGQRLIFRYDNTGHHQKLNLPTFPHHKHDGGEDNVIAANAPTLGAVLQEIAELIEALQD
jgi:Family of unknown function (DUF6516)